MWRAVVTGPVDTPYALGCFEFDIFCPPEYPSIPPLVHFATTGGGVVKFNPNLYAEGKVCLSLLGTFSGADATEKWDPTRSTIYQVLVRSGPCLEMILSLPLRPSLLLSPSSMLGRKKPSSSLVPMISVPLRPS